MPEKEKTPKSRDGARAAARAAIEDMFRGKTPDEWRKEYAGAYDWGPDAGCEIIED